MSYGGHHYSLPQQTLVLTGVVSTFQIQKFHRFSYMVLLLLFFRKKEVELSSNKLQKILCNPVKAK